MCVALRFSKSAIFAVSQRIYNTIIRTNSMVATKYKKNPPPLLSRQEANQLFAVLAEANPIPKTELDYTNEFTLLVAIVLSAQATDVGVNKATSTLFKVVDTPAKMAVLGEEKLKDYIKTIGLFNSKAKNVIALSKMLLEEFDGEVPRTREELQRLPGVGRKTANVWLNCALGEPTIAVDTHVQRVSNRIGLVDTPDPLKTELALEKAVPKQWKQHAHHWLILHGRYVCKARKPLCGKCSIIRWCRYGAKEL